MPRYFVRLELRGVSEGEYDADDGEAAIEQALDAWTMADVDADVDHVEPVVETDTP